MGGKYGMHRRKHESTQDFYTESQKERDNLAGPRCRWENNINMKLRRGIERKGVHRYFVAQDSNTRWLL